MKTYHYVLAILLILILGSWYYSLKKEVLENNLYTVYKNESLGFSIKIPKDFTVDEKYQYQVNSSTVISGVKFTIPESLKEGTNLSSDTYISVEAKPGAVNSCSAEIYLDNSVSSGFIDSGGHRYSMATFSGAAAGNRYDETVFATPVDGGCIAVRYFVHYGVFENYPEGSISRFDEVSLKSLFDSIRETLVLD
ncbi:MAG: hypothetical protein CEO12_575 [Parcubacteria group bacterium Gr01-1014_46]|nr:MAG: hypothetical protein CEO12_575 [Parcubacteria group bacterium Gr01-1014_46]